MDSQGPPTTAPLPAPAPGCCCWWHCRCQYRCCRRNLLPHTSMHAPNILTVQQGGPLPPLTGQSATPPTAEHPLKANSTMTESNQSWICVINGLVSLGPLYSQRRRRPLRGVPLMHPPSQQSQVASIFCRHHRYLQSPSSIDHQPEPSLECSASTCAQSFNNRRSWKMRGLQDVPSPCISPCLMRPKRWPL